MNDPKSIRDDEKKGRGMIKESQRMPEIVRDIQKEIGKSHGELL